MNRFCISFTDRQIFIKWGTKGNIDRRRITKMNYFQKASIMWFVVCCCSSFSTCFLSANDLSITIWLILMWTQTPTNRYCQPWVSILQWPHIIYNVITSLIQDLLLFGCVYGTIWWVFGLTKYLEQVLYQAYYNIHTQHKFVNVIISFVKIRPHTEETLLFSKLVLAMAS